MAHLLLCLFVTYRDLVRNAGTVPCLMQGAGMQRLLAGASSLVTVAVAGWQWVTRKSSPGQEATLSIHSEAEPAQQDLLTGLADRAALGDKLAEEWQRERRPKEPTALLLIGLDDFNALEKASGALGTDVALLTLARALGRMLPRKADLLARYDRASFAVVLPGTDLSGALRVAARLRWAVVRLGIAHPATESGFVSASLGIAVQHGVPAGGSAPILKAAHCALLKAEQAGADRLEYTVLGPVDEKAEADSAESVRLPSLRAWVVDREPALRTLQN